MVMRERKDPTAFKQRFEAYKNGKSIKEIYDAGLPKYGDGTIPYTSSDGSSYNINPNVVGSEQLNITVPEVVVTGKDKRPMYQRYDAYNSTYDPDAIRSITDWAPITGDIGQGLDAYNAFKNKDYLQAGILGGMFLIPNAIEKSGKALLKTGLKYFPSLTKNMYDISKLYTKIEDNPRLRRYANDVVDLLNSKQISERIDRSIDDVDIAKQISNISNTPIAFSHSNKMWIRPRITLKPLGVNYEFKSPVPIRMRIGGLYDETGKKVFIKRSGRTPEQIRQTTYHEVSHISDNADPNSVGIGKYDRNTHIEGHTPYFDRSTEKRARLLSILTDARKHGVDINDRDAIEDFITSPDYMNHNLNSLINDYDYLFDKSLDFYDLIDNGYKDGKLPYQK